MGSVVLEQKKIVFNQPDLGAEEMNAVIDVMKSGWIGTGKISHQFEEEFCEFMGGGYAVAVSSCSIGLRMALEALESKGDVITTPLTFAATLNAIIHSGNNPVLIDVDHRGCLDMLEARNAISNHTQAIVPVHYSGSPVSPVSIPEKVTIIEDCAHMLGGKSVLSGTFKVFSFYPNKNITCGEGGMVWTKDRKFADRVRILSSQGLSKGSWERFSGINKYSVEKVGFKGNLPDILAAIGLIQLRRWPEMKRKRREVWDVYQRAFGFLDPGHSMHFYPLKIEDRDNVREKLFKEGIGTGIHYKPLHLEPAYEFLGYKEGDFPMAELWGRKELSLPVSSVMTKEDAERVVEVIQGVK